MRQGRYLNVILTINAILLAGLLWTQVAGSPLGTEATAQQPIPPRFPNASDQRQEMIELLRELNANSNALEAAFTSGTMKVTVTNIDDLDGGDDE